MTNVERALMTKELGKAQVALWAAFTIAAKTNKLDVAKALREQHKVIGAVIVKLNGGPIITMRELLR